MNEIIRQIDAIIAMHENGEAAGVKLHLNKLRQDVYSLFVRMKCHVNDVEDAAKALMDAKNHIEW